MAIPLQFILLGLLIFVGIAISSICHGYPREGSLFICAALAIIIWVCGAACCSKEVEAHEYYDVSQMDDRFIQSINVENRQLNVNVLLRGYVPPDHQVVRIRYKTVYAGISFANLDCVEDKYEVR